jgi:hypothetical protein
MDSTHWRIGTRGKTSSTSSAAVSAIQGKRSDAVVRRPPQLRQKPRSLHENAASFSAWQGSHWTRKKPCSSKPNDGSSGNGI